MLIETKTGHPPGKPGDDDDSDSDSGRSLAGDAGSKFLGSASYCFSSWVKKKETKPVLKVRLFLGLDDFLVTTCFS